MWAFATGATSRFAPLARAAALDLHIRGLEASTLIELTAFGTAVMMNYRLTDVLHRSRQRDDS